MTIPIELDTLQARRFAIFTTTWLALGGSLARAAPVRLLDDAAHQAFQAQTCVVGQSRACEGGEATFEVPARRRAVIEYVSGSCGSGPAETIPAVQIETTLGESRFRHYVVGQFVGEASGGWRLYRFGQTVRLYSDGPSVRIRVDTFPGSDSNCQFNFSGYLVPMR